jgi:hypothetical protein
MTINGKSVNGRILARLPTAQDRTPVPSSAARA